MNAEQVMEACSPVFAFFTDVTAIAWDQYALALADVNPGDLDDALAAIRRTHGFRNAPLPADIRRFADEAKRKRVSTSVAPVQPKIDPSEGEIRKITIKDIGTLTLRVLPDDHQSLQRFYCLLCKDTGWSEVSAELGAQMTVRRCDCWRINPEMQRERERTARYIKERSDR
jgi:hypothetical protein